MVERFIKVRRVKHNFELMYIPNDKRFSALDF